LPHRFTVIDLPTVGETCTAIGDLRGSARATRWRVCPLRRTAIRRYASTVP